MDARPGRDAFAVSTNYLIGPLLVKLVAAVAVTGINGNLICLQRAAATLAGEEKLDERTKGDPMDIFDIFQSHNVSPQATDKHTYNEGVKADATSTNHQARGDTAL